MKKLFLTLIIGVTLYSTFSEAYGKVYPVLNTSNTSNTSKGSNTTNDMNMDNLKTINDHNKKLVDKVLKVEGISLYTWSQRLDGTMKDSKGKTVQNLRLNYGKGIGGDYISWTMEHNYTGENRELYTLEEIQKLIDGTGIYGKGLNAEKIDKEFKNLWKKVRPLSGNPSSKDTFDGGEVHYYVSEFGGIPLSGFSIIPNEPLDEENIIKEIPLEFNMKGNAKSSSFKRDGVILGINTSIIKDGKIRNEISLSLEDKNKVEENIELILKSLEFDEKEIEEAKKEALDLFNTKESKPRYIETSKVRIGLYYYPEENDQKERVILSYVSIINP